MRLVAVEASPVWLHPGSLEGTKPRRAGSKRPARAPRSSRRKSGRLIAIRNINTAGAEA